MYQSKQTLQLIGQWRFRIYQYCGTGEKASWCNGPVVDLIPQRSRVRIRSIPKIQPIQNLLKVKPNYMATI